MKKLIYKGNSISFEEISSNAEELSFANFPKNKKACVVELSLSSNSKVERDGKAEVIRSLFGQMAEADRYCISAFCSLSDENKKDIIETYEAIGFTKNIKSTNNTDIELSLKLDSMGIPMGVSPEIRKLYIDDIKDDLYNIVSSMVETKSEARSIIQNVSNMVEVLDTPKQVYDYILGMAGEENEKSYESKIDEILSELTVIYKSLGDDYDEDSEFAIKEKKNYIKLVSDLYVLDKDYARMNDKYISIDSVVINGEDLNNENNTYVHGDFPTHASSDESFRKVTITTGAMSSEIIIPEDRESYHLNSVSAVSREAQLLGHELGAEMARYLLDTKFNSSDEKNAIKRKRAQFQMQTTDIAGLIKNNYFGIKTIKTFLFKTLGVDLSKNTESLFDHLYAHKDQKISLLRDVALTEEATGLVTRGFAAISDENEPIFFVSKNGQKSIDDFTYLSGNSIENIFDKYTLSEMNAMNREDFIKGTLTEANTVDNMESPKI